MEDKESLEAFKPLKKEIESFFCKHGMEPKVIFRTCRTKFGDESPGNLIPLEYERKEKHINIYVDFRNEKIDKNNIEFIIAFPDTDSDLLPRLRKVRLPSKRNKIDSKEIAYPYKFDSLEELYKEYFARFDADQNDYKK